MNIEKYGYKLWTKKPNTICPGAKVYTKKVHVEVENKDKDRLIRVYLPSTYDFSNPNKRFPVIYMMDGKNLFDDYTSFVGEWGVDETIEEAIKRGDTDGIIVVGIDSAFKSADRALEMVPPDAELRKRVSPIPAGYAQILGDFIFHELKKEIDVVFYTMPEREHTGVGGSSMGGLMAYFLYRSYREYVGYSISFSPAFFLYKKKTFYQDLEKYIDNKESLGKICLYVGGVGFESEFVEQTRRAYMHFLSKDFIDGKDILYIEDPKQEHNEKAWRKYFPDALKFFNYLK